MQLTNILRDVKEDHERGRLYLPPDWLQIWNVDLLDLHGNIIEGPFKNLIESMISVTRKHYREGFEGVKDLSPGADFVVELSGRIYGGILDEIEKNDYQVLQKRHFVLKLKKLYIASKL